MSEAKKPARDAGENAPGRVLETLESLLTLPSAELASTLTHACDLVARALGADKVDAFLLDPGKNTLVAVGNSTQPLSALQRQLGLDMLPLANGGRVVHVFQTGATFVTGNLDRDQDELRGIREALKVRSALGVPLEVGGQRRGVLMVASQKPEAFAPVDVRYAEIVVRWVGMVAHRAELVEQIARNAREQGRQAAAEELVTVLAHDLRNLLAPISGRLVALQTRAQGQGRDEDIRDAELASKALRRLSALITNLLDNTRIDQGMFHLERRPLSLAALARDVGRLMTTNDRPVEVAAPEEVCVDADAERLRQCLENIVANAVQHSPRQVPVMISVRLQRTEDQLWAQVVVRDEGPGIPAELLPRLFERFASGHGSAGLGLGLYVARRIIEAHGGRLSAESSLGQGARFLIELPAQLPRGSSPRETASGGAR
jgi:two-component system, OmpR family, sensor kinase